MKRMREVWRATTTIAVIAASTVAPGLAQSRPVSEVSTLRFDAPHTLDGLFTTRDGSLYAAGAWNSDELIRIEPDGTTTVVASGLRGPIHGAEDSDGQLWISNFMDGSLSRLDPATGLHETVVTGLDGPAGVAVDAQNRVYVAEWGRSGAGGKRLVRILADGTMEVFAEGGDLDTLIGVALDGEGHLFVSNARDGKIHAIDVESGAVSLLAEAPAAPNPTQPAIGHMVFHEGRLYLAGNFRHVVYSVDARSGELTVLAGRDLEPGRADGPGRTATLTIPNGVAISLDGSTLWIGEGGAQLDEAIRRIDLAG